MNDNFLVLINHGIVKLKIATDEFEELKMRKSKVAGRNKIHGWSKASNGHVLCLSKDYCLKVIDMTIDEHEQETFNIYGHLCPFCLRLFSTQFSLYRDHIDVHKGPIVCENCKVSKKLFIY